MTTPPLTDHRTLLEQLRRRLSQTGTLPSRLRGWEGVIEVAGHSGRWAIRAIRGTLTVPFEHDAETPALRVFGEPIVLQAVLGGHLSVEDARVSRQLELSGDPAAIEALERLTAPLVAAFERPPISRLMACAV